jgi:phosphoenolpyruvate carboxykinase (GTP)
VKFRRSLDFAPRIFNVNWFRKDANGEFLWPGFGENMRVLKWIVDRCRGRAEAIETELGWVPSTASFDLGGLPAITPEKFKQLQAVIPEEWQREISNQDELFAKLAPDVPRELMLQRELLAARLL